MKPDRLSWANEHSFTKRYQFEALIVPDSEVLHLQPNETIRKVSYNADGSFLCLVQREVDHD